MPFKSEVRDSTINDLLEKASSRKYGQYLPKLVLKKIRGFVDEPISFDFPVTAIVGPNGGGKTTVLGAAAIIYRSVTPRTFFAKSGKYDEGMLGWSIEYDIVDRKIAPKDSVRRTASFRRSKWSRDPIQREVLTFGVSRTVPASERRELVRCTSGRFSVPESRVLKFPPDLQESVARILGKDVSGFQQLQVHPSGNVTLLMGKTAGGVRYSEFHFGAGESSIIKMLASIEAAKSHALVLIEEIENGLHPIATVRLVEYLIWAAERKNLQVIFTTHSNDALQALPSKAIWAATNDKFFQGKLDIAALRAITGQILTSSVVFVEDLFAKSWIESSVRQVAASNVDHFEVYAMSGDSTAVAMNKYHNENPSTVIRSVCIIDGDSKQIEDTACHVYRLPGQAPEAYVFDRCLEAWKSIGGKLSVALLQEFEASAKILSICKEIRRTNKDTHLLFSQLGAKLGLIPESTIVLAFTTIWAQTYKTEAKAMIAPIMLSASTNLAQPN